MGPCRMAHEGPIQFKASSRQRGCGWAGGQDTTNEVTCGHDFTTHTRTDLSIQQNFIAG